MSIDFTAEIEEYSAEGNPIKECSKPWNHARESGYFSVCDLTLNDLPNKWRMKSVLEHIKIVSKFVVHLTVLNQSPMRKDSKEKNDRTKHHTGTGFITIDENYGALVHTSKHVVLDTYEARNTLVWLFYDKPKTPAQALALQKLTDRILKKARVQYTNVPESTLHGCKLFVTLGMGSARSYFRSVRGEDYTVFSCQLPVHELFSVEEKYLVDKMFSWWSFRLKDASESVIRKPVNLITISHPHGWPKKIGFGRCQCVNTSIPAWHNAPTCSGSSGAPIIRLHNQSVHYLCVGQYVHHGCANHGNIPGIGMNRPHITFPYIQCFESYPVLLAAVSFVNLHLSDFLGYTMLTDKRDFFSSWVVPDILAITTTVCLSFLTASSCTFLLSMILFWMQFPLHFCLRYEKTDVKETFADCLCHLITYFGYFAGWLMMIYCEPGWCSHIMAVVVMFVVSGIVLNYLKLPDRANEILTGYISRTLIVDRYFENEVN